MRTCLDRQATSEPSWIHAISEGSDGIVKTPSPLNPDPHTLGEAAC